MRNMRLPHLLIAEYDSILRKQIVQAIVDRNDAVTIHEAENAEEAINIIKKLYVDGQSMDVVITGIQMPKASGLMLIAFLNAFASLVPCFVITAYGTERLKAKMPPNLLRFYEKPFDIEELAISALAAINRQRDVNTCGGINLHNFIYLAATDRVTATITVTRQGFSPGIFFMKNGELIDAITGDKRGEAAAVLTLSWPSPNYAIEYGIPDEIEKTIKTPLPKLLRIVNECFDNV